MHQSKSCFKCNLEKPLTDFYAHSAMADGHLNKCKQCTKNDSNKHRGDNLEKVRAYDRERAKLPKRVKARTAFTAKWRKADSRVTKCHNAVARAIKKGVLKVLPCCICGDENSVAHHESYEKPLDVIFYCQAHHKERHKEMALLGIDPYLKNQE
jgi:hypothetical protein